MLKLVSDKDDEAALPDLGTPEGVEHAMQVMEEAAARGADVGPVNIGTLAVQVGTQRVPPDDDFLRKKREVEMRNRQRL